MIQLFTREEQGVSRKRTEDKDRRLERESGTEDKERTTPTEKTSLSKSAFVIQWSKASLGLLQLKCKASMINILKLQAMV